MTESIYLNTFITTPSKQAVTAGGLAVALGLLGAFTLWRSARAGSYIAQRIGQVTAAVSVIPPSLGLYYLLKGKTAATEKASSSDISSFRDDHEEISGSSQSEKLTGEEIFDDDYDPDSCDPAELGKAAKRLADLFPPRKRKNDWQKGPGNDEQQVNFAEFCEGWEPIGAELQFYILPFFETTEGEASADLCELTGDYLEAFYGRPCTVLDSVTREELQQLYERWIDAVNRRTDHQYSIRSAWKDFIWKPTGQVNADFCLLNVLPRYRPEDAASILMLTDRDLNPGREGWKFVFGQGILGGGSGVWSIRRFGRIGTREFETRFLKLTAHETGHSLGLSHCVDFTCDINGYNHREDLDDCPMFFCAEDLAKVCLVTGSTPIQRCEALKAFYEEHGYEAEAKMMEACLKRLRAS